MENYKNTKSQVNYKFYPNLRSKCSHGNGGFQNYAVVNVHEKLRKSQQWKSKNFTLVYIQEIDMDMVFFSKFSVNKFLVKNCENPDHGDGHGKLQIWSWKSHGNSFPRFCGNPVAIYTEQCSSTPVDFY